MRRRNSLPRGGAERRGAFGRGSSRSQGCAAGERETRPGACVGGAPRLGAGSAARRRRRGARPRGAGPHLGLAVPARAAAVGRVSFVLGRVSPARRHRLGASARAVPARGPWPVRTRQHTGAVARTCVTSLGITYRL